MKKQNLVAILRVLFDKKAGQLNSSTLKMSLKKYQELNNIVVNEEVNEVEFNAIVEYLLENSKAYKEIVNPVNFNEFEVVEVVSVKKNQKVGTIKQAKEFLEAKGLMEEFLALVNA